MSNDIKIGVIGGDARQSVVADMLSSEGVESAVWGVEEGSSLCTGGSRESCPVRCVDWKDALCGSDAVLLPLPITTDGVRLNCPELRADASGMAEPRLTEIIDKTSTSTVILGGKIPRSVLRYAEEHNVRMIDYYEHEDFQIKNAVPTAEGAIAIAMDSLSITLADSRSAVIGYGRIGRTLAHRLLALSSRTTCVARSRKDLAWAECDGCVPVRLEDYKRAPEQFDVIFNTVPHIIFDSELLSALSPDTLFIDLASQCGGIDTAAAEAKGIRVVKALSLPGKTSPRSAGRIIFDTVREILREEGIL